MLKIGTSGYSYQDWIGPFYPEGTKKSDMLSFYAREFDFTEINSTYYQIPNPYMMYHLVEKTPEGFQFSIKAHSSMTHSRDADDSVYEKFIDALKPVLEYNRLACLVVQFPFSFHFNKSNMDYIKRIRENFRGFELCIEFRNKRWICQASFDLMKALDLSFICVDEPDIKGLINPIAVATSSTGYIRFHGRNAEGWYNHRQSHERYDYLYSQEELREWIPRIKTLSKVTQRLYIAFNNHFRAQGVQNARMLKALL